jgi:hypothetical protein
MREAWFLFGVVLGFWTGAIVAYFVLATARAA